MNSRKSLIAAFIMLAPLSASAGHIFKCEGPNEHITYSDTKCRDGEREVQSKDLEEATSYVNLSAQSRIEPATNVGATIENHLNGKDTASMPPLPPVPTQAAISVPPSKPTVAVVPPSKPAAVTAVPSGTSPVMPITKSKDKK